MTYIKLISNIFILDEYEQTGYKFEIFEWYEHCKLVLNSFYLLF